MTTRKARESPPRRGSSVALAGEGHSPAQTQGYEATLWFPAPLPLLQADVMANKWARHKYRKDWHARVIGTVLIEKAKPPALLTEVGIEYVRRSTRRPDYQNLVYSFKPITDGLINLVIPDDSDDVISLQSYKWEKWSRKESGVLVRIWQIA